MHYYIVILENIDDGHRIISEVGQHEDVFGAAEAATENIANISRYRVVEVLTNNEKITKPEQEMVPQFTYM